MATIRGEDVVGGGTFASVLGRAVRRPRGGGPSDDGEDWTAHHVDHGLLESALGRFARRRSAVRDALLAGRGASSSGELTMDEAEFNAVVDGSGRADPPAARNGGGPDAAAGSAGWPPVPGSPPRSAGKEASDGTGLLRAMASCRGVHDDDDDGAPSQPSCVSPYLAMDAHSGGVLSQSEMIRRLSHDERSELSYLLDSEVSRAATFYRGRVAELSPRRPAAAGGGGSLGFGPGPSAGCGAGGSLLVSCRGGAGSWDVCGGGESGGELSRSNSFVDSDGSVHGDDLLASTSGRPAAGTRGDGHGYGGGGNMSFAELGSEILELHAFVTTNVIAVRQILIRYDAYARSVGGSPMGSWYQASRGRRVRGQTGDWRDLVLHAALDRLTRTYAAEQRRRLLGDEGRARGGVSRAYRRLVDGAEEAGRRQRLKWRQSAMMLEEEEEEDDDDDGRGGVEMPPGGASSNATADGGTAADEGGAAGEDARPPAGAPPGPQVPDYSPAPVSPRRLLPDEDVARQAHIFRCVQSKTRRSIEKTYSGAPSGWRDGLASALRDYFVRGSVSDNLSLTPEFLVMRGKSLRSSVLVVARWREGRDGAAGGGEGEGSWPGGLCVECGGGAEVVDGGVAGRGGRSWRDGLSLFMNIFACFLYMMNYYIVEPSSTRYANALGTSDAMSGLIIGAMPWAAMASAVAYSVWSNRQYRAPLLTSCALLVGGNVLYASALRAGSIGMALGGRFLTGLGGPRSMNRRYIADTTPVASRTAVNAAFGTATAMGAALGPATAVLLDRVNFELDLPLYGTAEFNGMTGPGFLMSALWLVFAAVLAATFVEPERTGLEEQRRREEEEAGANAAGPGGGPVGGGGGSAGASPAGDTLAVETRELDGCGFPTDGAPGLCAEERFINPCFDDDGVDGVKRRPFWRQVKYVLAQLNLPVRICMFLLFSKMFTVESVISAASMVTKNRYGWAVHQVGTLGMIVGCLTIPISVFIGWISQYREDRVLMLWLMSFATLGMALLIDVTDMVDAEAENYNEGNPWAVGPRRYIAGYLLVFCSVQAFDGVVGSVLSKVIPTALATGTLNSGLLATVLGTFGRACGDVYITSVGYVDLRQILNLLFVPSFMILVSNLALILCNYDSLTA